MGLKTYMKALFQWTWQIIVRAILILLGLVVVAIAISFRKEGASLSDGRYISNLSSRAWLRGNGHDGLLGDNCFFVDSADDALKFKDAQGIVHVVSLVL